MRFGALGESGGTANNTDVILNACDGANTQQWLFLTDGEIVNEKSNRCIEDPSDGSGGEQLVIYNCDADANETWNYISPTPSGTGEVKLRGHATYCLDNSKGTLQAGNPIDLWSCNGNTDTQQWTIEPNGEIRIASSWCISENGESPAAELVDCTPVLAEIVIISSDGSLNLGGFPAYQIEAAGISNGADIDFGAAGSNNNWEVP